MFWCPRLKASGNRNWNTSRANTGKHQQSQKRPWQIEDEHETRHISTTDMLGWFFNHKYILYRHRRRTIVTTTQQQADTTSSTEKNKERLQDQFASSSKGRIMKTFIYTLQISFPEDRCSFADSFRIGAVVVWKSPTSRRLVDPICPQVDLYESYMYMYIYIHTYIHTYIYMYIYIYIYIYVCMYRYIWVIRAYYFEWLNISIFLVVHRSGAQSTVFFEAKQCKRLRPSGMAWATWIQFEA